MIPHGKSSLRFTGRWQRLVNGNGEAPLTRAAVEASSAPPFPGRTMSFGAPPANTRPASGASRVTFPYVTIPFQHEYELLGLPSRPLRKGNPESVPERRERVP